MASPPTRVITSSHCNRTSFNYDLPRQLVLQQEAIVLHAKAQRRRSLAWSMYVSFSNPSATAVSRLRLELQLAHEDDGLADAYSEEVRRLILLRQTRERWR